MAAIVTNGKAFPGTSFNLSNNIIEVGLGNKLLVDVGIVNTIVMGGWNRLMACTSTTIQMGTKIELTMANTVSVFEGDSWMYSGSNNTTYDIASRWGVWINLFAGGTSLYERDSRLTEEEQSRRIRFAAIMGFLATVAISLVGIQFPPFTMTVITPGNSEGSNPETGEIYTGGDVIVSKDDTNLAITMILDTMGILFLFWAQWTLAKKMADRLKDFNAVANLALAANGLTSAVFSDPERQPMLLPDGSGYNWFENNNDHAPMRYDKDGRLRGSPNPKAGSSPAAIFNMLPGMPIIRDNNIVSSDPLFNWKNIKKGLYPPHNNQPVITLRSQLELHKKIYSALDITPESVIITSKHGFTSQPADNDKYKSASIILQSGLEYYSDPKDPDYNPANANYPKSLRSDTKESLVNIAAKDKDDNGGYMTISEKSTEFYRKGPGQHFYSGVINGNKLSELFIDESRAGLSVNSGKNGLFIDTEGVHLGVDNKKVFSINKTHLTLGRLSPIKLKPSSMEIGGVTIKMDKIPELEHGLSLGAGQILVNIEEKIRTIKARISLGEDHVRNTGGFSGSVNDDTRKYARNTREAYSSGDNIKLGTFSPGRIWDGIKGSFWPFTKKADGSRRWFT